MAINNVNEFLRKTFSKTIFGTPALRPIAVCADGFNLSIQASSMHYCRPSKDLQDGDYSKVELGMSFPAAIGPTSRRRNIVLVM